MLKKEICTALFTKAIYIFCGALFLMFDGFVNGFPIVYSDTSTYIASGFEVETPFDRPITYGLFIRAFSLNGLSLWFVVFFQSLLLSYLIFLLIKQVAEESYLKYGLITIIILSVFTGVSWTASQLMPDIFTSIALIAAILILLGKFKKRELIFLYTIFFFSIAMHISHLIFFALFLIILFALRKYFFLGSFYSRVKQKITIMFFLVIISIIAMSSAISKSKHVFLMGAMVEHGIAQSFLNDNCGSAEYKLCAYKDSLPDKAYKFIWDEKSPFYKIGGWEGTKEEFNKIIFKTLTTPKYIRIHIAESCKATIQQLILFGIGDGNGSFLSGTRLYERVEKYIPSDLHFYSVSNQNKEQFGFIKYFNMFYSAIIIMSSMLLIFFSVKYKSYFIPNIYFIIIAICTGVLLNAWSCGTFANAVDRLGCKMIWLIPFLAIITAIKIFDSNRNLVRKKK